MGAHPVPTQSTLILLFNTFFFTPTHPTKKHGNKLLIVHVAIPVYIRLSSHLLDHQLYILATKTYFMWQSAFMVIFFLLKDICTSPNLPLSVTRQLTLSDFHSGKLPMIKITLAIPCCWDAIDIANSVVSLFPSDIFFVIVKNWEILTPQFLQGREYLQKSA